MFEEKEIKALIDKYDEDTINTDSKLKYINNKINKHGLMYINISELNYLYYLSGKSIKYDVTKLKDIFKNNNTFFINHLPTTKISQNSPSLVNQYKEENMQLLRNRTNLRKATLRIRST